MNSEKLDAALKRLRELFQQEYLRGQQDALRRVVNVMNEPSGRRSGGGATRARGGRIRARRGSARAFIERVLTRERSGATVPQIMAAASSADEKAVSISAIRFELYRGKKEKRYRNVKGTWTLPSRESK